MHAVKQTESLTYSHFRLATCSFSSLRTPVRINLVLEEAFHPSTAFVISYHPPIFKPLCSFTPANPLQASLLMLVAVSMSIYSPPTTLDSVRGEIHDFLASGSSVRDASDSSFDREHGIRKGERRERGEATVSLHPRAASHACSITLRWTEKPWAPLLKTRCIAMTGR